jgi:hypothetical protein
MSMEEYATLRVEQADRCGACKEPLRFDQPYQVHIDHDQRCCSRDQDVNFKTCGKCVRALLCNVCNQAVGFVERYPHRVHMWIEYVRRMVK